MAIHEFNHCVCGGSLISFIFARSTMMRRSASVLVKAGTEGLGLISVESELAKQCRLFGGHESDCVGCSSHASTMAHVTIGFLDLLASI